MGENLEENFAEAGFSAIEHPLTRNIYLIQTKLGLYFARSSNENGGYRPHVLKLPNRDESNGNSFSLPYATLK